MALRCVRRVGFVPSGVGYGSRSDSVIRGSGGCWRCACPMREMWVGVVGVLCCLVNSVAVATAALHVSRSRDGG